jgi:hypothetical protein
MHTESTTNRNARPCKAPSAIGQYKPRKTALARRRRLNRLVRELADDLGFERLTMAERSVLFQCAALALQTELMQEAIVRGEPVNGDELIRLSGEARRMLIGLRKRVKESGPSGPTLAEYVALKAKKAQAAR